MKLKRTIIAILGAAALAACLVSCAAAEPEEDYTPNFVGSWELVSSSSPTGVATTEDIELLRSLGDVFVLTLNAEGGATLDQFDTTTTTTWEAHSATEASIVLYDQPVNITLENEQLRLDQGGDSVLYFAKAGTLPAPGSALDSSSLDSTSGVETEEAEEGNEAEAESSNEAA